MNWCVGQAIPSQQSGLWASLTRSNATLRVFNKDTDLHKSAQKNCVDFGDGDHISKGNQEIPMIFPSVPSRIQISMFLN